MPLSYQLATKPAWEGAANTSCVTMAPLPPIAPPIITPDLPERQSVMRQQHLMTPQQLPIMHPPGGLVGSSSVFALTKMRDRLHHHAPLGGFSGGFSNSMSHSVDESQSAARTPRFTGLFQGKQVGENIPFDEISSLQDLPYPRSQYRSTTAECKIPIGEIRHEISSQRSGAARSRTHSTSTALVFCTAMAYTWAHLCVQGLCAPRRICPVGSTRSSRRLQVLGRFGCVSCRISQVRRLLYYIFLRVTCLFVSR